MQRIIEIDKEIDALDKEKKNFARRINYQIKKLKDERSTLLSGLQEPEPFELVKENAEYDIFAKNRWNTIPFLQLSPGDIFRVRADGKVKTIQEGKTFSVVCTPYPNLQGRHAIKVRHHELPPIRVGINLRLKAGDDDRVS